MSGKRANPTGQAVYRLNFQLRLPGVPGEHQKITRPGEHGGIWVPAGNEILLGEMAGLDVQALVMGGIVEKVSDPQVACDICQEHGTQKQKKERYASKEELREHYAEAHPGYQSTEEV